MGKNKAIELTEKEDEFVVKKNRKGTHVVPLKSRKEQIQENRIDQFDHDYQLPKYFVIVDKGVEESKVTRHPTNYFKPVQFNQNKSRQKKKKRELVQNAEKDFILNN